MDWLNMHNLRIVLRIYIIIYDTFNINYYVGYISFSSKILSAKFAFQGHYILC